MNVSLSRYLPGPSMCTQLISFFLDRVELPPTPMLSAIILLLAGATASDIDVARQVRRRAAHLLDMNRHQGLITHDQRGEGF